MYGKIGIDRALWARDTSCPKGKKVELRRIKTIWSCELRIRGVENENNNYIYWFTDGNCSLFCWKIFIKSRNTERSVLFLSGDYTGLNTEKICRVTGKRIKTWAMLFCLGGIIDFIKLGAGIIIVSVFFIILLVFHLVDMTINRDKYRV